MAKSKKGAKKRKMKVKDLSAKKGSGVKGGMRNRQPDAQ
jgi:hypothetical protein